MAITSFFWGGVTQSIAGTTFSKWKDKNVMKNKVPRNNTSSTPAQEVQRRKFKALAILAKALGPSLRIGFRLQATSMTEMNVFQSLNKDAVTDNGTIATVNYSLLHISAGTIAPLTFLTTNWDSAAKALELTWTDNSNGNDALPTDIVYFSVANVLTGEVFNFSDPVTRADQNATATVPFLATTAAANIRVYLFLKRASNTSTSPSQISIPS